MTNTLYRLGTGGVIVTNNPTLGVVFHSTVAICALQNLRAPVYWRAWHSCRQPLFVLSILSLLFAHATALSVGNGGLTVRACTPKRRQNVGRQRCSIQASCCLHDHRKVARSVNRISDGLRCAACGMTTIASDRVRELLCFLI